MKPNYKSFIKLLIVFLGIALTLSLSPKFLPKLEKRQDSNNNSTFLHIVDKVNTTSSDAYNNNWRCNPGSNFNDFSGKCEPNFFNKNIIIKDMITPKIVENIGLFHYEEDKIQPNQTIDTNI